MSSPLLEVSLLSLCLLYGSIFSLIAQASLSLRIDNYPFQLSFYNTTPDAFTLALRMGNPLASPKMYFVWEANRGKPVRVNATLTLGEDGNLVLADVDGSIAWQTYTARKGVSFDHPTDTLLAGQSLRLEGTARLVSRASEKQNSDGPYSLVLEPKRLAMYYKSPSSPRPYLYYTPDKVSESKGRIQNVTLYSRGEVDGFYYDFALSTPFQDAILITVNYNNTLSFLRLGIDGNLRIHTFYDKANSNDGYQVTFTLFSRDSGWESECQLPERCGRFGLCEDNQCVACPLPNGLMGWSRDCQPCDCKCLGYFYNKETSKCWIVYDLHTLTRVGNSAHVGYIKAPK
ncbi:hypothetical protein POTOM_035256 [Populus tomentosa]|uniref:Bulb-type lectin domain-containing protein n=1 Tax=Populus tomentosa TaxID=118781 RepID=A0A8X8CLP8_POPTO|nr:hypothetical protein POTOM_035256 [Populus tomentosa]